MSAIVWLGAIALGVGLWWFGFVATKQMRIDKNKERTLKWEKIAALQKKEREAQKQAEQSKPEAHTSEASSSKAQVSEKKTAEQQNLF